MAEALLTLHIPEQVRVAYSSLGDEYRHRVDTWFEHLRNWRSDEYVRARSRRLKTDEELYAFQTSSDDIVIVFRIASDGVTVVSILRRGWLRAFEAVAERSIA